MLFLAALLPLALKVGSAAPTGLLSTDQVLAKVDEVTVEEVNALARELLTQPTTTAAVGPFAKLP